MRLPDEQEDFLNRGRFGDGEQSLTRTPVIPPTMVSAFRGSLFPHAVSSWWIPLLVLTGWGPLFFAGLIIKPDDWAASESFGMGWGMSVAFPCSVLAVLSVPVQAFRLMMYFLNRPKPL